MYRKFNRQQMIIISLIGLTLVFTGCSSSQKKELSSEEKKAAIYYGYGTTNLLELKYTEALKNLLMAVELNPKDTKIHNNLGMAYFFKKQNDLAIQHLTKSLELDPKNADARNNLASVYFTLKRYEDAQKEYQIVAADLLYDKQFRVFFNLGLIAQINNQEQKAIDYFQKSIVDNPGYCSAHFKLGEIHLHHKNNQLAYESFHNATLGQCVNEPEPHYFKALTLIKMGELGQAKGILLDFVSKFSHSKYSLLARQRLEQIPEYIEIKRSSLTKKNTTQSQNNMPKSEQIIEPSEEQEFLPYKTDFPEEENKAKSL